jgi:hypothetical protein
VTRRRTPTPRELAAWAAVADVPAARGTYRWRSRRGSADDIGWFGFAGDIPAPLAVPPGTDVAFWYAAPDRWRIEVDAELVGVSDGRTALARHGEDVHVGSRLLAPTGPARLLQPDAQDEPSGEVAADVLLDRACWRWTASATTWWLDHDTGVALAYEDAAVRAELLELELTADGADFTLPADLLAQGRPLVDLPPRESGRETEQRRAQWRPEFTVPWWPRGTLCWPDSGDPAVPEVLLVLGSGRPRFWLGVAPLPREAPVKRRARTHRWTGDGWSFALSWRGDLTQEELARVVGSVPAAWA